MSYTPWKSDQWLTSQWNFAPEVTKEINFPEKIQIHDSGVKQCFKELLMQHSGTLHRRGF